MTRAGLTRAVRAEWTKLRTVPSTPWLLVSVVVLMVAIGAATAGAVDLKHCPPGAACHPDTTRLALAGVWLGQVVVVVLGVLVVAPEYGDRLIQTTLAAVPRRTEVLAAKAAVVAGGTLGTGLLGVLGSILVARIILPRNGFSRVNGYPPLSLADGATLRAATGTVLYLLLIGLLALGVAAVVRDAASSVTVVLALLFAGPIAVQFITNQQWNERLRRFAPSEAGLAIQSTVSVHDLPVGPWAGLGVLAAWSAAAVLVGGVLLVWRDA